MRRIDDEKPRTGKRLLAMRSGRSRSDVEFEPEDVGLAERGDRIEKMGVGAGFPDRTPGDVSPGWPFAQGASERALDRGRFAERLERRVDQDEAPALVRRQVSVERDIAVRAHDAEPAVSPERRDQRRAAPGFASESAIRSCGRMSAWAIAGEPGDRRAAVLRIMRRRRL